MSDTTIAIIGALISGPLGVVMGAALGYWLNKRSLRQQESRAIAQLNHNVRTLLYREIEDDLAQLRDYLFQVKHQPSGAVWEGSPTEVAFQERRQFLYLPQPRLSHLCWETQLSSAPSVLTPQQLREVYHFHSQLETIRATYAVLYDDVPDETLCVAYEGWRSTPRDEQPPLDKYIYLRFPNGASYGSTATSESRLLSFDIDNYLHRSLLLWFAFEGLINGLVQRGNPLIDPDEALPGKKAPSLWSRLASRILIRALGQRKSRVDHPASPELR